MDPAAAKMIFLQSAGLSAGLYLAFRSRERNGWIWRHSNKILAVTSALCVATVLALAFG